MSYIPTDWSDNDEITSVSLNHLESGVTAVGYEPTQWSAGDVVTAEKLNKLEQGVAESADVMVDYINRSITEFTITPEMNSYGSEYPEYFSIGGYGFTFRNCSHLTKVNGLELITYEVSPDAFTGTALTEIDLPNAYYIGSSNDNYSIIGGSSCAKLSCKKAETIYKGGLSGAASLEYLYLPSAKTIGDSVQGCSKIKHVYIGANCTSIGSSCFSGSGGQSTGLIIDCGFAEGAVSGAPWGATNATINYNVPDPGSIDAMIEGNN